MARSNGPASRTLLTLALSLVFLVEELPAHLRVPIDTEDELPQDAYWRACIVDTPDRSTRGGIGHVTGGQGGTQALPARAGRARARHGSAAGPG